MVLLALLASTPSIAAIYSVGTPTPSAPCTHSTIAAAIAAAASNPGADKIRLATNLTYIDQALMINSNDDLEIVGGFLSCNRFSPEPGVKVVIDGANASVFRIFSNGRVTLRQLEISGGNATGASEGGGIYYQGNGTLDIADSDVINNTGGYGGGIYARGTGTEAELLIGANVTVANNTARYSGGGIYIDQLEMAMREPNSAIFYNTAIGTGDSGYGGGLTIRGAQNSAYAYVGTSGIGDSGAIFANEARYGGGVAVVGGDSGSFEFAELQLFTTDPLKPATIRENVASVAGGGLFLAAYEGAGGNVRTLAKIYNANLDENEAPRGAAAFLQSFYSNVSFNPSGPAPDGAVPCAPSALCGGIVGNRVEDVDGNPGDGAVIELIDASFRANIATPTKGGIEIRGNAGGRLAQGTLDTSSVSLANALVTANEVSADLFSIEGFFEASDTTIAGNAIGARHVIEGDSVTIRGSILWQPGKTTIAGPMSDVEVSNTIASEISSLNGGGHYAPPRFVDPARGDYRLRAASAAVDFRAVEAYDNASDRDAFTNPRIKDLSLIPNFRGPIDLGAIETQSPFPLVLNGYFDVDRNLWSDGTSGTSSWSNAYSYPGSAGGSVFVTGPGFVAVGSAQCVHLPVPARYNLNGAGRNQTATNTVSLRWEFRRNGGESCTNGSPDRIGSLLLADSTLWSRPAEPVAIDVPESEWTMNSSITITMVASGRDPGGWFDAITLDTENLVDQIFADGFD